MALTESQVKAIDKKGMLNHLLSFPDQLEYAQQIGERTEINISTTDFNNIVLAGMGGSAIGGDLLRSYLAEELRIPFFVNRNYRLPAYVNKHTLVIASSYSGNTEETLSCFEQACTSGAQVICVTSGGKLEELTRKRKLTLLHLPSGLPPRAALGYLMVPVLVTLSRIGLIGDKSDDLRESVQLLRAKMEEYHPSREANPAKTLSQMLYKRLPLIYACGDHLEAVALRWKGQLCENSKTLAFQNVFPELNHNEVVGWGQLKDIEKRIQVVYLKDKDDHERNRLRMRITREIVERYSNPIIEVSSEGESLLARIFSLIYLGDFISLYLSVLNKVDPTPVENIDYLKKRLSKISN